MFFLFTFLLMGQDFRMVDEHSVRMLGGVAGKGNKVFVVYHDHGIPIAKTHYYFLDLTKGQGKMIEDQRIKGGLVLNHPSGFVISQYAVFGEPQNFLLSSSGEFQNIIDYASIKDWPEDIAMQVFYGNDSRWVVNYDRPTLDNVEPDQQFLGVIPLDTMTFRERFAARKDPAHQVYWLPLGKNYLLLNQTTGGATFFDGQTFVSKSLLPDLELRESKSYKEALKTGRKVPAFLRYTTNAKYATVMPEKVSFVRQVVIQDEAYFECVVVDSLGKLTRKRNNLHLLWEHEGTALYLDLEEETFALNP